MQMIKRGNRIRGLIIRDVSSYNYYLLRINTLLRTCIINTRLGGNNVQFCKTIKLRVAYRTSLLANYTKYFFLRNNQTLLHLFSNFQLQQLGNNGGSARYK